MFYTIPELSPLTIHVPLASRSLPHGRRGNSRTRSLRTPSQTRHRDSSGRFYCESFDGLHCFSRACTHAAIHGKLVIKGVLRNNPDHASIALCHSGIATHKVIHIHTFIKLFLQIVSGSYLSLICVAHYMYILWLC